ncbi:MAG: NAD(P)-dependent alcohol dehydrogenase [Bacteroidota bacterium]
MKAMVFTRYGPPEVLHLTEVAKPVPKDTEVLITVYATTVNRTDCGFLRASPWIVRFFSGLRRPKYTILGNEFSGQIEAVGKGVTSFAVGDRVFGFSGDTFGAHAEYLVMPGKGPLATIPERLNYKEAAPGLEGSHYALSDIRAARIQKGQKVLVYGATGAIGSAAVQIVKQIGAYVTAVCGTENVALVKSLGADKVVDYEMEDFTKDDQVYDVVFDAVGKSSFGRCTPLLRPGGIYLSTDLGYLAQNPFLALITPLFGKKKVLFPIPTISKKDVLFIRELLEAGTFKPVIDRCYRLDQVADAFRYVETGQKKGNVVVEVSHRE